MSKPSEWNELKVQLNSVAFPKIDVSGAVMDRIRELNMDSGAASNLRRSVKRPKVLWITAAVLFFLMAITASAAVLPFSWNGASISIEDDGGKNARIDAFKELIFGKAPTYKETIDNVVLNKANAQAVLTLEEARQQFPFAILRPVQGPWLPTRSNGALMNEMLQENGKNVRIIGYRPVFHDIYELDGKRWAIVTQSLDKAATDFVQGKMSSRTVTYGGKWENIKLTDTAMAMYAKSSKENRLVIEYKNEQTQVVDLLAAGNISKEELIKLAEAYIGK